MNDGIHYKYKECMQIYTVHRNPKPPFSPSPSKKILYAIFSLLLHVVQCTANNTYSYIMIINVPVFYMALGLNDFDRDKTFLVPEEAMSEVGLNKSRFSGPIPSNDPWNGFATIKGGGRCKEYFMSTTHPLPPAVRSVLLEY